MDNGATPLNIRTRNLYTLVWLGCPAFQWGEPPVDGKLPYVKQIIVIMPASK
jgi:hypothetical protein